MHRQFARAAALMAFLFPLAAVARQPVDIEIYDRSAGRTLPVYWHHGERYVAGEPGHEYELRIRNRGQGRVLAVTSVDGVNVITGRTASTGQSGYVIDPYGTVRIDGWRKSMDEVAAFYFTSLPDSYAARTGRPDNVGVIGVAVFQERIHYPEPLLREDSRAAAEATAPSASRDSAAGKLGTGHGGRRDSGASYTSFERESDEPASVIRVFYDSRRKLVAQGVIPRGGYARNVPDPFPGGFVPDP